MKFAALCTANDGDERLLGSFNTVGRSKAGNVAVTNEGIVFFTVPISFVEMVKLARVHSQLQLEQGLGISLSVGLAAEGRDTLGQTQAFFAWSKAQLPAANTLALFHTSEGFDAETPFRPGAQNNTDRAFLAADLATLKHSLKEAIGISRDTQTQHTEGQLSRAAEEVEKMITRATTPPPGVVQRPGWPLTAAAVRVGQRALSNT